MSKWSRTMKLEELKEYWHHNIQIQLKDGSIIKGEFVGFEHACDEPTGRDCITIYTEESGNVCVFINEIIKIYERYVIDDRPDNHPEVVKRREVLLNSLSSEEKQRLDDLFKQIIENN